MSKLTKKLIIAAKAGGGKDFFRDYLSKYEKLDVSYTTRPKRDGEKEGYTYNYISKIDFEKLDRNGFFKESLSFNSWNYGTGKSNWEDKKVFIMTPSGINSIPKEELTDCTILYLDIPLEQRKERLMKRSDADKVDRRLLADEQDFSSFSNFNIRITNPFFNCEELYSLILDYENL